MKRFLRRIGAVRSTIVAAGIVAAAVGLQVVRADEHMPGGFFNAQCVRCCHMAYTGENVCIPAYECEGSMWDYPKCYCKPIFDSQGRVIGAEAGCIYGSVPQ